MYDAQVRRWGVSDPKCEAYTGWSQYNYVLNNPLKYVDTKGEDVYLIIWASGKGGFGHAAIAIDNYKTEKYTETETYKDSRGKTRTRIIEKERQVKDGTLTYLDLWPRNEGGIGKKNFQDDVEAKYQRITTTLYNIKTTDVSTSEDRIADGIIKLSTSQEEDREVKSQMDAYKANHTLYNAFFNNCANYAAEGILWAASSGANMINYREEIVYYKVATSNQLYKKTAGLPNATVIKDAGTKVEKGFLEAVTGGGKRQHKAEKELNNQPEKLNACN